MNERTLTELRQEIKVVDSDIARLLGRRMKLAEDVGVLKQKRRMPIVDAAVERRVIKNFVASAARAGVNVDFAKHVASLMIEGSVEVQEKIQPLGHAKSLVGKVAVIGAGGMGSWFARFFKSRGSKVTVSDLDPRRARVLASRIGVQSAPSNAEAVRGSDLVVLAIPTNALSRVVDEILWALKEDSLLVEICAVKTPVIASLRLLEKRGVQIASIHPMFGPLTEGLRGRTVVIVRTGRRGRGSQSIRRLLTNARFFVADPDVHDKHTALTLALPHFLNMAFAMTISKSNLAEVRQFAGRTFDLQLLLTEKIASEPETTADIQIMNKEFQSVLQELKRNVAVLARTVGRRDRAGLIVRYKQIRDSFAADPNFAFVGPAFERACEAAAISSKS